MVCTRVRVRIKPPLLVDNQSGTIAEGEIRPSPLHKHKDPVTEAGKEIDMHQQPGEPC